MERETKKQMILIGALGGILILGLVLLLSFLLTRPPSPGEEGADDPDTKLFGLLQVTTDTPLPAITAEQRQEDYDSRLYLDESMAATLDQVIQKELSSGAFQDLDDTLRFYESRYRDANEEENQYGTYASTLSLYRRDLAVVLGGGILSGFTQPDVLAAAIVYGPLSAKVDVFLNQDSAILPAVDDRERQAVNLHEVEKSIGEIMERMEEINLRRNAEDRINGVRTFEFVSYGHPCRLELVSLASFTWAPWSLEVLTPGFSPMTVSELKEIRQENEGNPWFDLDAFYVLAAPSDTDERGNEAATGTGTAPLEMPGEDETHSDGTAGSQTESSPTEEPASTTPAPDGSSPAESTPEDSAPTTNHTALAESGSDGTTPDTPAPDSQPSTDPEGNPAALPGVIGPAETESAETQRSITERADTGAAGAGDTAAYTTSDPSTPETPAAAEAASV